MPDTTYLHIQGRESDPTRVVALPGAAVRVGRGPQCEVRLSEPELAEVQCFLRRRGETWQIQPVGPTRLLTIEGQPVEHLRSWPFGVPLQVGSHRLVIRPSQWGTYETPFEVGERFSAKRAVDPDSPVSVTEPTPRADVSKPAASGSEAEVERLRRWQTRLEQRERWLQTRQDEKTWESRWKAAGEGLRSRSTPPRPDLPRPAPSNNPPRTVQRSSSASERLATPAPKLTSASQVSDPKEPRALVALPKPITIETYPPVNSVAPSKPPEPETQCVVESPVEALPISKLSPPAEPEITAVVEAEPAVDAQTILPIERMILIESDRPDPIWNQPSPLVVEASPQSPTESVEVVPAARIEPPVVEPHREPPVVTPPLAAPQRDEYPSAAAIFAAQGTRAASRISSTKRAKRRPIPTEPRGPSEWVMPAWLGVPPAAIAAMGLIGIGLILAGFWSKDNMDAGLAAKSAFRTAKGPPVPIDPTFRPETLWWKTTASHLAHWVVAIERSPEAKDRVDEVREILNAASLGVPLQPEIRFALAQSPREETTKQPAKTLGLSRDVVTLTITGRFLKRAGKIAPAIRAYRTAMELASDADLSRLASPIFDDDPEVRRFRLPHEALIQSVAQDMLDAGEWNSDEWMKVVPPSAVARLAVARLLRAKGNPYAGHLIDLILTDESPLPSELALAAESLAAKAEALAFKDQKAEAAEVYRKAITLATDETTRRRWRLGLAEILGPLGGASKERAEMLEAAKGSDPTEEVTQKAIDAQKLAGLR